MSIGGSVSGISFSGLSSGIDTDSIISKLVRIEQQPVLRLQQQQAQITQRLGLFGQFRNALTALSAATRTLNQTATYNPVKATSSDEEVATVTATSNSSAGIYELAVRQLALSNKLSSNPQANGTDALNKTGTISVGGKDIDIVASDSLTTLAQKINGAGSGVTAGILDGGAGRAYISLSSNASGLKGNVKLEDKSGTILADLGFLGQTVRGPITNGASSYAIGASNLPISDMLDMDGYPSNVVTINSVSISVGASETLDSLAAKLNASGAGVTATVQSETIDGRVSKRLEIVGSAGTPTFGTEGNFWLDLGVTKRSSEVVAGQDALFSIDGIGMTSSSNSITAAIPGSTVTLLKGNVDTPEKTTLSLARDGEATKKAMRDFADAYNAVVDFVDAQTAFNKDTFETGALFGDSTVAQIQGRLSSALFAQVDGITSQYKNLAQVGFSLDDKGKLNLDEAAFDGALSAAPDAVASLMRSLGSASSGDLAYVSSTNKTKVSGSGGFAIMITQAATKGAATASTAQTGPNAGGEELTFQGSLFGDPGYKLVLAAGLTLQQTVDKINSDASLKDRVVASIAGGKLKIDSKRFGGAGDFSVVSNLAAGSDNSGIGVSGESTYVAGLDVAGTINGEEAVGSGQFLSGKAGNSTTDGLQIQYRGSQTGTVGTVTFTRGVASQLFDAIDSWTDSVSGLLTTNDKALNTQFEDLGKNIDDLNIRIAARESMLRAKFQAMESAMQQLQAQSQRLAAMLNNKAA